MAASTHFRVVVRTALYALRSIELLRLGLHDLPKPPPMDPPITRELGVERGAEDIALADRDDVAFLAQVLGGGSLVPDGLGASGKPA